MSIRTPASAGGGDRGSATVAGSVKDLVEKARIANSAWMVANATKSTNATNASSLTPYEMNMQATKPWKLIWNQEIDFAKNTVVHTVVLSNGPYSRLHAMVEALSNEIESEYSGFRWTVIDEGTVMKVCTNPELSTGRWRFERMLPEDYEEVNDWLLPGGFGAPMSFMKAVLGERPSILDDEYTLKEIETPTPGLRATVTLEYQPMQPMEE